MEQPNRENPEEPPATKVGGRKLIAIIVAVVVVLVALAVAAIYYLGQGSPCATPASLAWAHPESSKASPSDASPASMVRASVGVGKAITQVGTITVGFSISLTGTFNVEGTNSLNGIKANHPSDRIAALYASDSFSTLATQSAVAYAQSIGLRVVYNQSYPTTATDLSTELNAAKLACADDLIGGGHFNDGLLIMNQLKTIWTPKFVSLLVAVTEPTFPTQLAATANQVAGPSYW